MADQKSKKSETKSGFYHFIPTWRHRSIFMWLACYLALAGFLLVLWLFTDLGNMFSEQSPALSLLTLLVTLAMSSMAFFIRFKGAPLPVMIAAIVWNCAVVYLLMPAFFSAADWTTRISCAALMLGCAAFPVLLCLPFMRRLKTIKAEFRAKAIAERKAIKQSDRAQLAKAACERLFEYIEKRIKPERGYIALYSAMNSELPLDRLAMLLAKNGYRVAYPAIIGETEMAFYTTVGGQPDLDAISILTDPFAMQTPEMLSSLTLVESEKLSIIVVPGTAFDSGCYRLGYGGGYYDRYIARSNGTAYPVGICFDEQYYDALPVDRHDQVLRAVATPTFLYTLSGVIM